MTGSWPACPALPCPALKACEEFMEEEEEALEEITKARLSKAAC